VYQCTVFANEHTVVKTDILDGSEATVKAVAVVLVGEKLL